MKQLASLFLILLLASCGSNMPVVLEFDYMDEFHKTYVKPQEESKISPQVDLYIDYSDGMYDPIIKSYDLLSDLLTILPNDNTSYFRVGFEPPSEISKADILDNTASPYYARNVESYQERLSLLKDAINQIVKHKDHQSVFVTDFELVETINRISRPSCDGGLVKTDINDSNWAKEQFAGWLSQGNGIDIYAKKFSRSSHEQYLYFIVFTPKEMVGVADNSIVVHRLNEAGYDKQNPENLYHFSFNNSHYFARTNYEGKMNEELALGSSLEYTDHHEGKGLNYEYYQLQLEQILGAFEYEEEHILFERLFFVEDLENYQDFEFEIKTYDITETFASFNEAKDFEDSEYSYQKGKEEKELFELVVGDNKELKIKMQPDKITSLEKHILYRVDVYLKQATRKLPTAPMQEVLTWTDRLGGRCLEIKSLAGSLEEAMTRTDLQNRLLYSYYVEVGQ